MTALRHPAASWMPGILSSISCTSRSRDCRARPFAIPLARRARGDCSRMITPNKKLRLPAETQGLQWRALTDTTFPDGFSHKVIRHIGNLGIPAVQCAKLRVQIFLSFAAFKRTASSRICVSAKLCHRIESNKRDVGLFYMGKWGHSCFTYLVWYQCPHPFRRRRH